MFHTFKDYYNEVVKEEILKNASVEEKKIPLFHEQLSAIGWKPLDKEIGETVKKMKQTYK